MTHTRGDALQLVGINTRTGAAAAIGVPRDSWVDIPGHGNDKINASLYFGGPQLLGQTVGNLVGIQPDYVFVTRFPYFIAMVDGIGGIDVHNPRRVQPTTYLKPKGFRPGGSTSAATTRWRSPGSGTTCSRGDFDRSANQQRVLRGIQAKVRARAGRPGFIERGVLSVMQHLHTDLPPAELFRLAQAMAQVEPVEDHHLRACRAASATSAAPAWCFPDRPWPAGSATTPGATP